MSNRRSEAVAPSVEAALVSTVSSEPIGTGAAAAVSRTQAALQKIDSSTAEVVQWGNGGPESEKSFRIDDDGARLPLESPADKATTKPAAEKPAAKEKPVPDAIEPVTEEEPPATAKPATSDRRRQILESLDREGKRVEIETRVKEEQTRREAAEQKLADFEKSPLGKKIAAIAKQHNMTVDDLKDKLLIGADDVLDKDPAPAAAPKEDPRITELLAKDKARDDAAAKASWDRAVDVVRDQIKDIDVPMIDAFDAHGRVLAMAHKAWVAGDKKGAVGDFLADSAAIVEDQLREERPRAAARLYPATEETRETADIPAPKPAPAPRPAMGRRTAARPGTKPAPLPMDPHDRDEAIRKRFGWD